MKLYEIPQEIERFEQQLVENGGELTPEIEKAWADFINQGQDKLEAAGFVLLRMQSDGDAIEKEIKRLQERQQKHDANEKRLKDLTLYALRALGGKLKTALVTMWTGRTGKTVSLEVKPDTDLELLHQTHPHLVRRKFEANLSAAKDLYVKVYEAWERECEAALLAAGGEASEELEAQFQKRWKELLEQAELPDVFNVTTKAGTEYLRVK